MGVAVSSSHVVSATPCSSGEGLLTLCPCSSMGSIPREAVPNEPLQHEPFPRAAALYELPQRGSLPKGCSPSGTDCSIVGPPWGHKLCQQTCSVVGFSLHGSTGPGRSLLHCGLPPGSQPPSGMPLLQRGFLSPQVRAGACSIVGSPQGHSLLQASPCSGVVSSLGCRW